MLLKPRSYFIGFLYDAGVAGLNDDPPSARVDLDGTHPESALDGAGHGLLDLTLGERWCRQ
jgi:hypothetical protein